MKRSFFQAAVTSILLYGCTTWTLTKRPEKKLDGNYTRMLRAILNKSWWQHPTRHQLYGHLPPITKTIQVRRTRHAGHCWRSRDEIIRDVLVWTPTHGRAKAGRPARTYIQQLCEDTGCCPEDLPRAMNNREEWRERVRDIRATSTTWWWWWCIVIDFHIHERYYILKVNLMNYHILSVFTPFFQLGASGGVIGCKLDLQSFMSEFKSHWVPYSYDLVTHLSKKLCKLLLRFTINVGHCFSLHFKNIIIF